MLKISLLLLTLVALAGCNYRVNKAQSLDDGIRGLSADQLTYQAVNTSVLAKNCVSCHSQAGGNKGGVNLETYAEVKRNIKEIREQVADKSMPPRTQLSDAQINMIITWIDAGASEDGQPQSIPTEPTQPPTQPPVTPPTPPNPPVTPPPVIPDPIFTIPADPKDITFEMVRVNVLVPKCLKCHSAPTNKGDVNLETYSSVMENLKDAYDDIMDGSMPKGKNLMTDDQKQLFFRWHDAGAKENGAAGLGATGLGANSAATKL
ncbi:MAG: c-type cytochrome [Bdellovibrio sp.]|nr:c-type cytochrome [Bdellovibrio sp.]